MKERNVLVLATDYPKYNTSMAHRFVHVRNLFYKSKSILVTVLNFSTEEDYEYEGIRVISLNSFKKQLDSFKVLISHQPNLRQHYVFLKKYGDKFIKFIFFFHGHEVLRVNKVYSKPYSYMKKNLIKEKFQDIYDIIKLIVWKKYFVKVVRKSKFIFVSNWMSEEFFKWVQIPRKLIEQNSYIIYNCVDKVFEEYSYNWEMDKIYDFITIRSNLDASKYSVDIVCKLAEENPDSKFLLIGRGKFFEYNNKPQNITWIDKKLSHMEIINFLQKSKCALMPTRTDAQGLMMCEMATFGIPLITSDLDVCNEVLGDFENVSFIDNSKNYEPIVELYEKIYRNKPFKKNDKYFNRKTSQNEVDIINSCFDIL